jgi:hypothetical protein
MKQSVAPALNVKDMIALKLCAVAVTSEQRLCGQLKMVKQAAL